MEPVSYVLDACAMIAYLRSEPGAEVVSHLLKQPEGRCAAHAVNLCEVYYNFLREADRSRAEEALSDLMDVGIAVRRDLGDAFLKRVGDLKGIHRISLADAFAIALAQEEDVPLVTSDHHEFDALSQAGVCAFEFIR